MKLRDLIERLEEIEQDLIEGLGEDVEPEVVCAIQPNYPLAVAVQGACVLDDDDDDDDADDPQLVDGRPIVWLATSNHAPHGMDPYAPRAVWDEI